MIFNGHSIEPGANLIGANLLGAGASATKVRTCSKLRNPKFVFGRLILDH